MSRADEKKLSREADARALASGEKTVEDLRRENGHFSGLNVRVDFGGTSLIARVKLLEEALRAVWLYEDAVQRDLSARGEVSDGTMYLMLQAHDLRVKAGFK